MAATSDAALGHARATQGAAGEAVAQAKSMASQLQDLADAVAVHKAELRAAIAALSQALVGSRAASVAVADADGGDHGRCRWWGACWRAGWRHRRR